jgi:hypothetical protein
MAATSPQVTQGLRHLGVREPDAATVAKHLSKLHKDDGNACSQRRSAWRLEDLVRQLVYLGDHMRDAVKWINVPSFLVPVVPKETSIDWTVVAASKVTDSRPCKHFARSYRAAMARCACAVHLRRQLQSSKRKGCF